MSSHSFDALELLRDELCEMDLQVQSEAMKRLHLVAPGLGPSRARDQLIHYLKHSCSSKIEGKMDGKLEDELLMLLAVEVKSLPPFLAFSRVMRRRAAQLWQTTLVWRALCFLKYAPFLSLLFALCFAPVPPTPRARRPAGAVFPAASSLF
jgi:hypothetical protein